MDYTELDVDGYERVLVATDGDFRAIVAIHSNALGIALGGCRALSYDSLSSQLTDTLSLAKGMTYKNALAGLGLGGGKATINTDKPDQLTMAKFSIVMDYINKDGTQYITAGDMNTGPKEIATLSSMTPYVNGGHLGEDSGYATAYGVYMAMLGAMKFRHRDIRQQHVGIQGLGKVGMRLAKFLHREAKGLYSLDVDGDMSNKAFNDYGATPVHNVHELIRHTQIYSPCARGGILNSELLLSLSPGDVVCGGANNIFTSEDMEVEYAGRGIIVVPDFLANAGGVIIVQEGMKDGSYKDPDVMEKLKGIMHTTHEVLTRAEYESRTPTFIAMRMAEEIFNG